jgi:hypothetical protein
MPETEVAYNFQIQKSTSNGGGGVHHNVGHNIQRCRSHTHDETSAMMLHHRHSSSSSASAGNLLNNNNDATSVSAERSFKGIRYRPELGRYISEIRPAQPRKRKIWLGTYKTAEEAARAFDAGIYYTKKSITYNFEDSPKTLEPLPANLSPEQEHIEIQKKAKAAAARAQPVGSNTNSPPQSATSGNNYHHHHHRNSDHLHHHHHRQVHEVCGYETSERKHPERPQEIIFAIVNCEVRS